jgi:hypothetical protein
MLSCPLADLIVPVTCLNIRLPSALLLSGDLLFKHPDFTKGKPSGLTAEPDIVDIALEKTDQFIILACDGKAANTASAVIRCPVLIRIVPFYPQAFGT